jgi:hypothetical protein
MVIRLLLHHGYKLCNNHCLFNFCALQMGGRPNVFPHELLNLRLVLSQLDAWKDEKDILGNDSTTTCN